ncbi:MAG: aminopeptidase P family protein [Prevotellaceae bacterium]|jgi:Xaa-Pro aminopeptidase|nr:aminopeptidase P family protein [Prevotellaceae bacterium]
MFSKEIYIQRRLRLREQVQSGLILLLGNHEAPMNYVANTYHFRQDSSFLYFLGLDEPGLAAVIDLDAGGETLFGTDATVDDVVWMGVQPTLRAKADSAGIAAVSPYATLAGTLRAAVEKGRTVHFLPPYRSYNKILLHEWLGIPPAAQKEQASPALIRAVVALRIKKELCEIAEIEKACAVGYRMHLAAMAQCRAGAKESDIAGAIEGIAIAGGAVSFPVILSQNGETLHNHDHSQTLTDGRLLVIDAGAETRLHYASDYTRTLPAGGRFTARQKEIYNIVLEANNHAVCTAKPGITYRSVHLEAAKIITCGLQALGLMTGDADESVAAGAHALFFPHGLGHQMGLDVHDMEDMGENYVGYDDETQRAEQFGLGSLRMGRRLQEGFCITVEPGIYFIPALIAQWKSDGKLSRFINYPKAEEYIGFGGVRLEDDILITADGCRLLGERRIPITTDDVEAAING